MIVWRAVASIWRFFTSIRLTLILLILIGIGSILGSFVPQLPEQSGAALGQTGARRALWWFVTSFELADVFHSWWYSLLLEMLALNLLACTWSRVPSIRRALRKVSGTPPLPDSSSTHRLLIPVREPPLVEKALFTINLGVNGHPPQRAGEYWYGEAGRLSRTGFLFVHVGVMVILVAGGLSQVTRIEGWLSLGPGEKSNAVSMRAQAGGTGSMRLPFEVRCKRFAIERYAASQDAIKEYVSELEIVSAGEVVRTQRVEVNAPLSYGGYNFYQSSYQNAPEHDRATFTIEDPQGVRTKEVSRGEPLARGADGTEYRLQGLRENYYQLGDVARIESKAPDGRVRRFWVFARHPEFVKDNRPGGIGLSLLELKPGYATILEVSRDPGVTVLWIGCISLLFGLLVIFTGRHRRVWYRLTGTELEVVTWAHRGGSALACSIGEQLRALPGITTPEKT